MTDKSMVLLRTTTETLGTDGKITGKETVTKVKVAKEPEFVKLYLQDILHLQDIPSGLNNILYEMLRRMGYDNIIILNSAVKRLIASNLNCSINTINKALTTFNKSKIIVRQDTGIYLFNPYLFGRGEWKNIESIRATIEWTSEGKQIRTTVVKKDEEEESSNSEG